MTMPHVHLSSTRVAAAAGTLAAVLVVATVVVEVGFDLAPANDTLRVAESMLSLLEERNLGTFGATLLLLGCAVAAAATTWLTAAGTRRLWAVISIGFVGLAADEMLEIHERTRFLSDALLGDGTPAFSWIVPGAVVVVVLAMTMVPQLRRLPDDTWRPLLAAAAVFLAGALGMESVGSALWEVEGVPDGFAGGVALVEEALEVAGTVVALWAITRHVERHVLPVQLRPTAAAAT